MTNAPLVPTAVLDAFGLTGPGRPLAGGAGGSIRYGSAVLKPVPDPDEDEWSATLLAAVQPRGFRLSRRIRATDGRWSVQGWSASALVAGETGPAGRWGELFAAGRAFHAELAAEPRPALLDAVRHRWARADRVAWDELAVEVPSEAAGLLARLQRLKVPVTASAQLIHGDLSGNVLFADGADPAIIDFSPYWRPVGYADAIVVVDGLLWFGAGPELIAAGARGTEFAQLLIRAVIFRLIALTERAREDDPTCLSELSLFGPVVSMVERL